MHPLQKMRKRKKRPLPPRTLRMKRGARLQSARHWLTTQTGRTAVQIAKSYRRHYGVDWPCAIQELAALGIRLDKQRVEQLKQSLDGHHRARARRRAARAKAELSNDSDETFAFIAGYTPGGATFGVTWEEWKAMEAAASQCANPGSDAVVPPDREPF